MRNLQFKNHVFAWEISFLRSWFLVCGNFAKYSATKQGVGAVRVRAIIRENKLHVELESFTGKVLSAVLAT